MPKSNVLAHLYINHFLRNGGVSAPATVYVGLFITAPASNGTGGVEVSGTGYARVAVTFNAPASGATANAAEIDFPEAGADWGTVVGWGVFSAATVGSLYYFAAISPTRAVLNGDVTHFDAGALTVAEA